MPAANKEDLTAIISEQVDKLGDPEDLPIESHAARVAKPRIVKKAEPRSQEEVEKEDDDEEQEVEKEDEGDEGEDKESEDDEEQDLSAEELNNAKLLFKALKNPRTATQTLQFLASQAGLDLNNNPPRTNQQVVAQAKDIIEEMKEAAPGLEFLIDKIGPVIKQNLQKVKDDLIQEVETDRIERANSILRDESTRAFVMIGKEFGYKNNMIPDNIMTEMTKLMSKVTPTPQLKPYDYISMLHHAARAKMGLGAKNSNNSTRKDSPVSRLAGERVQPTRAELPKKLSLNEAIAAAIDEASGS